MARKFYEVKKEHRQNKKTVTIEQMGTQEVYAPITLPTRATAKSAGHDIYLPMDVTLLPGRKTLIWTDVKVEMESDEVVLIVPRSSLGIKQGIMLSNTVGVIDSDYFENPGNDGNIGLSLLNTSGVGVELKAGERVAQAIFVKYGVTDDTVDAERVDGIGSTGI